MDNQNNKPQKIDKKESLLFSAINLFKTKGIANTTVADIAKDAGTAKGTFYLYFSDKNEIIRTIIMNEASNLLENAIERSKTLESTKLSDRIVFISNELINAFSENSKNIDIIHKNLYTGLFSKSNNDIFSKAVKEFIQSSNDKNITKAEKKLYIIIEMVGGICYNSIVHKEPYTLDEIKDELFACIRSIIEN